MMANRRSSKKPARTLTDQLNVRLPRELIRRVGAIAATRGETLAKFVGDTLNERTKEHVLDVQRIADREKSPKKWQ